MRSNFSWSFSQNCCPNVIYTLSLKETRCPVNFNTTTVNDVIRHSVKGLLKQNNSNQKADEKKKSVISENPNDYMLRLVGTDAHLFGDALLLESEHVRYNVFLQFYKFAYYF